MKMINHFFILFAVAAALLSVACGSDPENNGAATPVFPEEQPYTIAADQTQEVTFEANMNWTLTSDKQWLKFVDEIGETQSLLGNAGHQQVTLKVSAGNLGFNNEIALVTLAMGSQKAVVFRIERPGRERAVKMYTKQGITHDAPTIEIPNVEIAYEGRDTYLGFAANFDWRVISAPSWILKNEIRDIRELTGRAGHENLERDDMAVLIVDPAAMYSDQNGEIVVGAQAEGVEFIQSFEVSAAGIPAGEIKWSMSSVHKGEGFLFSQPGKWRKNKGISDYEEVNDPATCWVRTRDHKYTRHFVVWKDGAPKEAAAPWINITDDNQGNFSITAPANDGEAREAALFVIPEGATVDYADYFSAQGTVLGGQFAIKISQAGAADAPIYVRKYKSSSLYDELGGVKKASAENLALAASIGVPENKVYEKSFTADEWGYAEEIPLYNQSIQIVPNDQKLMDEFKTLKVYDQTGKEVQLTKNDWASISVKSAGKGLLACLMNSRADYATLDGKKLFLVFIDNTDVVRYALFIQKTNLL